MKNYLTFLLRARPKSKSEKHQIIFGRALICAIYFLFVVDILLAGGPLLVNKNGKVVTWDPDKPVLFTPDKGDLGLLSNSEAVQTTKDLFQLWEDVPTASITFNQDGQLPEDINGTNVLNFLNNISGDLSPIIFDDDGSVTDAIFGIGASAVTIGFAGHQLFFQTDDDDVGIIASGRAVMNGLFFDGLPNPSDLFLGDFRGTFAHEFGHFIGLVHSQINLENLNINDPSNVPRMFPVSIEGMGETLHVDDLTSVSSLYPISSFENSTSVISGRIFLPDGITQLQGANVIARSVSNPKVVAVSSFSGFLHLDQSNPDNGGSGDPALAGFYEIRGLEPGDYIVSIEQVDPSFSGASSVGSLSDPITLPGIPEFYNIGESNDDARECASIISVSKGEVVENIDIVINNPGTTGFNVSEREPNNSLSNPQDIPTFVTIFGNINKNESGLFLDIDDFEDVFSFTLNTTQFVSIFLSFPDDSSDLDLVLLDNKQNVIGRSEALNSVSESLGPIELTPGNYFIGVSSFDQLLNPSTTYTLDVTGSCIGDFVPNNSPTPTPNATEISTPMITPTPQPTSTPDVPLEKAELNVGFSLNPVPPDTDSGRWDYTVFVTETKGVGVIITDYRELAPRRSFAFDSDDFKENFTACGEVPDAFISGFNTACASWVDFVADAPQGGTSQFIFNGIDENGNNVQGVGSVELEPPTNGKSFTFKCEKDFVTGKTSLEKLIMDLGENETCTLKLTQSEPGVSVEILSRLKKGLLSSIHVNPARSVTNDNGELEILITALRKGVDWVAWAVPNNRGEFEFNNEAYKAGRVWGMLVEVR